MKKSCLFFAALFISTIFTNCNDKDQVSISTQVLEQFSRQLNETNELLEWKNRDLFGEIDGQISDPTKVRFSPVLYLAEEIVNQYELVEEEYDKLSSLFNENKMLTADLNHFRQLYKQKKELILNEFHLLLADNRDNFDLRENEIEEIQKKVDAFFTLDEILDSFKTTKKSNQLYLIYQLKFSILKTQFDLLSQADRFIKKSCWNLFYYYPVVSSPKPFAKKGTNYELEIGLGTYYLGYPDKNKVSTFINGKLLENNENGLPKYKAQTSKKGKHQLLIEIEVQNPEIGLSRSYKSTYTYEVY